MNKNASAFPIFTRDANTDYENGSPGLTIREKFAESAMIGLLAGNPSVLNTETIAELSVLLADALIKELEKS